jgi:hypothetical protein
MVNFGKKLMADQVDEWKGYDFSFGTYEIIYFYLIRANVLYFHICPLH